MRPLLLDVMSTLVYDPFRVEMPAALGVTFEEMLRDKDPTAWLEFERGEIDEATFLERFFRDGRPVDAERFIRTVRGAYRLLPGIEALLGDLQDAGVPMHTMSNYPSWYRLIEESTELSRYVRWTFVSCDHGIRKPSETAYRRAADLVGSPPRDCVFVDDRPSNVDGAEAVGMTGIVFESADQLRRALAALYPQLGR